MIEKIQREKYKSEIQVKVMGSGNTLTTKDTVYETYEIDKDDPVIRQFVSSAISNFPGNVSKVQVKITMDMD